MKPANTGQPPPTDLECDLFALPVQHGGLGIQTPSKIADRELQSSQNVTSSLKDQILDQDRESSYDIINDQLQSKANVCKDNKMRNQEEAEKIYCQLPDRLQKAVDLAKVTQSIASHYTHLLLMMLWLCGMTGYHLIFLPSVNMAKPSE